MGTRGGSGENLKKATDERAKEVLRSHLLSMPEPTNLKASQNSKFPSIGRAKSERTVPKPNEEDLGQQRVMQK